MPMVGRVMGRYRARFEVVAYRVTEESMEEVCAALEEDLGAVLAGSEASPYILFPPGVVVVAGSVVVLCPDRGPGFEVLDAAAFDEQFQELGE